MTFRMPTRHLQKSLLLCVLFGCGSHHVVQGGPLRRESGLSAGKLESLAFSHYGERDYIRALRYAYMATEKRKTNPRLAFLLGLIYDTGLSRPDLAIPEYRRATPLRPATDLPDRINRRIQYLSRMAAKRAALRVLESDAPPPLSGDRIAAFPFQVRDLASPSAVSLGLIDLILHDLERRSGLPQIDPFGLHTLSYAFQDAFPDGEPADFARWVGAGRTLTGTLIDLGRDGIQVTLQVLDSEGQTVFQAPPVSGSLKNLIELHTALLKETEAGLEISRSERLPLTSIESPLAFHLHTQGLLLYLSGKSLQAYSHLEDARALDQNSDLVARTLRWVRLDLEGEQEGPEFAGLYRDLLTKPDPAAAIKSRLAITHTLTAAMPGTYSGAESLNPFKPPSTEVRP